MKELPVKPDLPVEKEPLSEKEQSAENNVSTIPELSEEFVTRVHIEPQEAVKSDHREAGNPLLKGQWLKVVGALMVLIVAVVILLKISAYGESQTDPSDPEALHTLAEMYENGWGRERDSKEATRLYELAARKSHVKAQFRLGQLYFGQEGTVQNFPLALKWFKAAAKKGHIEAQYAAALMYRLGQGTVQDPAQAKKWYEAAASQGSEKAQKALDLYYPKQESAGLAN
jgi:TPR repeat protein